MKNRFLILILLAVVQGGHAQGFVNLDFEDTAITPAYPPGTVNFYAQSVAMPGWTPSLGIIPNDGVSTGGAMVSLQDTNALNYAAIQGTFSVLLQGSSLAAATTASIEQTGTIPNTAQSLTFYARLGGTVLVSFNGQNLYISAIGSGANYTIYGANIASYAGQTGQLLFTAPVQNAALLDNIQFSSSSVPEPSELVLAMLGALLFSFRRWRNFLIAAAKFENRAAPPSRKRFAGPLPCLLVQPDHHALVGHDLHPFGGGQLVRSIGQ